MGSLTVTQPVYPTGVLEGETALCLFAAGFGGRQDAAFLKSAGLRTTCVDIDGAKLGAMAPNYPEDWEYVGADIYEWVLGAEGHWDVVSVDCPTGHFERCAKLLPRFCELARHTVILGTGDDTLLEPPDGWVMTDLRKRSNYRGGVYWAVLER